MTTATRKVRVLRGFDADDVDVSRIRTRTYRDLVVDPEVVQTATDDGYRIGYQAGFDAALADAAAAIDSREQQRASNLAAVIQELAEAAERIEEHHSAIVAEMETQIVALAIDIAETLVGHDIATSTNPGLDALVRALHLAPTTNAVSAQLHPDDYATLTASADWERFADQGLTIIENAQLQRGDCIVDAEATRIDARLAPALARVREVIAQ
jgi:flagellar assembly protein FliH